MTTLHLMASRHSAFYSPLLGAVSGGFLRDEGFEPTYAVMQPGQSVPAMIAAGEVHVSQSAVSAAWVPLERNQQPLSVHFAQINVRDGFLIAGRKADPDFTWDRLLRGGFMFVHGGQPQAMLAYAMHRKGVDLSEGTPVNAGNTDSMMKAFRAGQGDYFHEQGPYPQQLEHEGAAFIVASVGEVIGPVAFSSLTASRDWLKTPEAKRFTRAYRKARRWVNEAPPAEVAKSEKSLFPHIDQGVLAKTIEYYQKLGCWSGDIAVPRQPYETSLDVFLHSKLITRRHPYDQVVVSPPEG